MADYAAVFELLTSDVSGPAGGAVLAKAATVDKLPDKVNATWFEHHADKLDAWLCLQHADYIDTCADAAATSLDDVRSLLKPDAVQRLRRMAVECYEPFPDCLLQAIRSLVIRFNTLGAACSTGKGPHPVREYDRVGAQLSRVCELYAARVGTILKRSRLADKLVSSSVRSTITQHILHPEIPLTSEQRNTVGYALEVSADQAESELKRYIKEAYNTLWVVDGPAL